MIQMLAAAGGWKEELTAKALAAGVTMTSLAGGDVTAEECQAAWNEDVRETQRSGWRQRFDAALNTFGTSEQADGVAALRAIADEMEA